MALLLFASACLDTVIEVAFLTEASGIHLGGLGPYRAGLRDDVLDMFSGCHTI